MSKRVSGEGEGVAKRTKGEEFLARVIEPGECKREWAAGKTLYSQREGYLRLLKPLSTEVFKFKPDEMRYVRTLEPLHHAWGYDCKYYQHSDFELATHEYLGTVLQRYTDLLFRNLCRALSGDTDKELLEYDVINTIQGQEPTGSWNVDERVEPSAKFLLSFLQSDPQNAAILKELAELPIFENPAPPKMRDESYLRPGVVLPDRPYSQALTVLIVAARQFLLIADGCWDSAYNLGRQFAGKYLF
jgi:hypothetical protein